MYGTRHAPPSSKKEFRKYSIFGLRRSDRRVAEEHKQNSGYTEGSMKEEFAVRKIRRKANRLNDRLANELSSTSCGPEGTSPTRNLVVNETEELSHSIRVIGCLPPTARWQQPI
jgi:hypothetical protein